MFKAFFTNSMGILTSRILGFVRDLLMALILGANIYSDIFFIAFKLPNLFRRIFAEGAFTTAFIPSFSASKHKATFSFKIVVWISFVVFALSILITIFSNFVTSIIAFGLDSQIKQLASPLVAINIWYLDFIFIISFLSAILQYKKHFATTAFSTALLNISLIFSLIVAKGLNKIEIVYILSYGVIIGGLLQLIAHLYTSKKLGICKILIAGAKSKKHINKDIKLFKKSFFPAIFASSAAHISAFLDTFLASFLISGSISYLYYANRILQLPLALFAIAISTALFPTISKLITNNNHTKAKQELRKSFFLLFILLSIATIIGFVFAQEIMWLLFERGEFTQGDTLKSAGVLQMYMIGLLPFGLSKLLSLWHFANHRQKDVAKYTFISLVVNILLSIILIIPFKTEGLALASSLSGFVLLYLNYKGYKQTCTIELTTK